MPIKYFPEVEEYIEAEVPDELFSALDETFV